MNIDVACAPDNNYAQHCAVMLASLFENNKEHSIHIHLLHNKLSPANKTGLTKVLKKYNAQFTFYEVDESMLEGASVTHHVSIATYFRLFMPRLINVTITKVLYLDSDLIILKNIGDLWETEISQVYLAATPETMTDSHLKKIGLQSDSKYFNGGVLLINLERWRKLDVFSKSVQLIKNNTIQLTFWDQDIMNILFEKAWKPLDYKWNVSHYFYNDAWNHTHFGISADRYQQLKSDPSILHFSGHIKPWDFYTEHPMKQEYYKYIQYTPWRRFKGFGAPGFQAKLIYKIRRCIGLIKK